MGNRLLTISMGGLLVTSIASSVLAQSDPTDVTSPATWTQWGLAGVVIGVTLWRDWDREKRMDAKEDARQLWIQNTLVGALEKNNQILEQIQNMDRKP